MPEISVARDGLSEGSETVSGMALLGYARVSTLEQDPSLQHDALVGAGCARVFTDRASGALDERVELAQGLDYRGGGATKLACGIASYDR